MVAGALLVAPTALLLHAVRCWALIMAPRSHFLFVNFRKQLHLLLIPQHHPLQPPTPLRVNQHQVIDCSLLIDFLVASPTPTSPLSNITLGSEVLTIGIRPSCWNASVLSPLQQNITKRLEKLEGVRVIPLVPVPQRISDSVWQLQFEIRPPQSTEKKKRSKRQ